MPIRYDSELARALELAERILENPKHDPDSDISTLARQLLRQLEEKTVAAQIRRWYITIDLNEAQQMTFIRFMRALEWSHHVDIIVRKDGVDVPFEADWLKSAKFEPA